MSAPPRMPPRNAPIAGTPLRAEMCISVEQLAAAAGISPGKLVRLIRLGLVEPTAPGASEFTAASAVRLKRMLRLHGDLGVNLTGAAIIVDLIERLEGLEAELARLRGRDPRVNP